jgi:hypothetical protein
MGRRPIWTWYRSVAEMFNDERRKHVESVFLCAQLHFLSRSFASFATHTTNVLHSEYSVNTLFLHQAYVDSERAHVHNQISVQSTLVRRYRILGIVSATFTTTLTRFLLPT